MNVFIFGLGYSSMHFVEAARGRHVCAGTVTTREKADALKARGVEAFVFSPDACDEDIAPRVAIADAILVSIPPDEDGDPALNRFAETIAASASIKRIVYLSTVGVYGDHQGAWIDEQTPCNSSNARSIERLKAEQGWLDLGARSGKAVHILRLSGIYGPGSNALMNLKRGTARRIIKKGQVFNRIHVEDIGRAIDASLACAGGSAVWNVTDDLPAPPQDVVEYAAKLMGVEPPPEIDFDTANMSPMARSFYAECKRVSNKAMKEKLGVTLAYPTYRKALDAMWAQGEGR